MMIHVSTTAQLRSIRWGVVGTGAAARRFLQGMAHVPNAEVVSVWGRNPVTARAFAADCNASLAANLEELLASSIDVVYIATLPDTHASYSRAALLAGKAVLCEKPVAMNLRELEEILALAADRKLFFMEAMKPPFFPVYRKLLAQIERDPIGPVRFVRSGYSIVAPAQHSSWNLATGGGGLMGIGVYHAFLAVEWMGEFTNVYAAGRQGLSGVDAFAALLTEHVGGGIGQLYCGLDLATSGEAVLAGPLGYVSLQGSWWNPERITVQYNDGQRVALHEAIVGGGFNYETAHVCDLLRTGATESPIMPHATSRRVMDMIERARRTLGVTFADEFDSASCVD